MNIIAFIINQYIMPEKDKKRVDETLDGSNTLPNKITNISDTASQSITALDGEEIVKTFFEKKELLSGEDNVLISDNLEYWKNKLEWYVAWQDSPQDYYTLGENIKSCKEELQLDDNFTGIEICDTAYDSKGKKTSGYSIWIDKNIYAETLRKENWTEDAIKARIEKETDPKLSHERAQD